MSSHHKKILKKIEHLEKELKKLEVKQEVKIENKFHNCPKHKCTDWHPAGCSGDRR